MFVNRTGKRKHMKKLLTLLVVMVTYTCQYGYAYDTYNTPEIFRSYGKQQIRVKNSKGNWTVKTPQYKSYAERNNNVSEKIVAIYDKNAPEGAYGYRYIIYKPIGNFIGYRKILQPSPNGYGFTPQWDGDPTGVTSKTPCFRTIGEAIKFYYPNYKR